jgi:hypothetical protein
MDRCRGRCQAGRDPGRKPTHLPNAREEFIHAPVRETEDFLLELSIAQLERSPQVRWDGGPVTPFCLSQSVASAARDESATKDSNATPPRPVHGKCHYFTNVPSNIRQDEGHQRLATRICERTRHAGVFSFQQPNIGRPGQKGAWNAKRVGRSLRAGSQKTEVFGKELLEILHEMV